jgi:hypothetical protein
MLPGSLIGFAMVFILVCGVLSAMLTCGFALTQRRLAQLGAAHGPWQVVGEESMLSRFLSASSGPEGNYRYASIPAADSLPSNPGLWWTLPNMIPGEYSLYGQGWLRHGREFTLYQTPLFRPLTVSGGQTTRRHAPGGWRGTRRTLGLRRRTCVPRPLRGA